MSKGLEALEKIKNTFKVHWCDEYYNTIEKELKRLEAIDNANPSEALECVNDLESNFYIDEYVERYEQNLTTIKQALLKAQKQECEDVETYNNVYNKQKDRQLTQEEFGLLNEVFEND